MPHIPLQLPPQFDQLITDSLGEVNPKALAAKVLQLSDHYNSKLGDPTPWHQPYTRDAYLAYFMPLNFVRLRAAFQEAKRFLPDGEIREIWDIGSGSGVTQWVLESELDLTPRPFYNVESAREAIDLHQELADRLKGQWSPQFNTEIDPGPGALGIFSYSFLEAQMPLSLLQKFDHLLIVEPSVRELSRNLMGWRQKLIEARYTALAPCTHDKGCPLLLESGRDWCHMRVHFQAPAWWTAMEAILPMKNRTLTYSYLLVSRRVPHPSHRGWARVIGDTLKERGKTRQMICRGEKREFLSWLLKRGEPEEIPHGALIHGVDQAEVKGPELRPQPGSLIRAD